MFLFSSDKELIFKITNAVLLIWLVGALIFTSSNIINLLIKEPFPTYEEYETRNCVWFKEEEDLTEEESQKRCLANYNSELSFRDNDYYRLTELYTSIANVIIVGGVMFFINKKDFKKKKK